MAEERGILHAPAWVYCNYTQSITDTKADSDNFRTYRYLTVDPDGERNIFCKDQPFLFTDDCKPYINIDPFPYCQSPYYGAALQNLIEYTQNKKWETITNGTADMDLLKIEELVALNKAYDVFKKEQPRKKKMYMCILHVLDRWFNESKNETTNTHFEDCQVVMEILQDIDEKLEIIITKTRKELEITPTVILEHFLISLSTLRPQIEDLTVYKNGWVSLNYKGNIRFKKEWNREYTLKEFDDYIDDIKKILKSYLELIYREFFLEQRRSYVKKYLQEIKELMTKFSEKIEELTDYGNPKIENAEISTETQELKNKLQSLELNDNYWDRKYINKDSFLVCRCGGMIKIMYDSDDGENSKNYIHNNLIKLIKEMESDLEKYILEELDKEKPQLEELISYTNGFNFLKFILIGSKEENLNESNGFIYVLDGDLPISGYGVEMNIIIRPWTAVHKKNNIKETKTRMWELGRDEVVDKIIGKIGKEGRGGKGYLIYRSIKEFGEDKNFENGLAVVEAVADFLPEEWTDGFFDKVFGKLHRMKDAVELIHISTKGTTADYVGQIQVELKIGTHDIKYIKSYNIEGKTIDSSNKMVKRMKQENKYIGTHEIYSSVSDIQRFNNNITLDYVIIANGQEEKGIQNYSQDEFIDELLNEY